MWALYREWNEAQRACLAVKQDFVWGKHPASQALEEVEARITAEPINSLEDLALKMVALTWLGDMGLNDTASEQVKAFMAGRG
jgi:hypothetical protein